MPEDTETAAPPIYYGEDVPDWQYRENFAPLPGGTMNAQLPPPAPVDPTARYTTPEQDRFLIQRNQDERNVALGIDPIKARLADIAQQEHATRMAGQLEYQQLVQGGASPEEALRRTADKLFFSHPDQLATALYHLPAPGVVPGALQAVPITGANGEQIGDVVYDPKGRVHASRFTGPAKMPPDVAANQKVLEAQLAAQRKELSQAQKDMRAGLTPEEKQDAARRALTAQNSISDLEKRFVQGTTNWMAPRATGPTMPVEVKPKELDMTKANAIRDSYKKGTITREDAANQLRALGFD